MRRDDEALLWIVAGYWFVRNVVAPQLAKDAARRFFDRLRGADL